MPTKLTRVAWRGGVRIYLHPWRDKVLKEPPCVRRSLDDQNRAEDRKCTLYGLLWTRHEYASTYRNI